MARPALALVKAPDLFPVHPVYTAVIPAQAQQAVFLALFPKPAFPVEFQDPDIPALASMVAFPADLTDQDIDVPDLQQTLPMNYLPDHMSFSWYFNLRMH